jgi:hypothetical protein
LPQSTVQAAGQAATDIIGGLKASPALLAIILLNMIGVAAAIWFLNKLIDRARSNIELVVSQMHKDNESNKALVDQCFVLARENQKDLRDLRVLREQEVREMHERELRELRERRGEPPPPPR